MYVLFVLLIYTCVYMIHSTYNSHTKYVLVCTKYVQVCNKYVPVYTCMYLNLTLKELKLPIQGPMEDAGVVKNYQSSPMQFLYVELGGQNLLGPNPCFLGSNTTLTIPHKYSKNKNLCFPHEGQDQQQCI